MEAGGIGLLQVNMKHIFQNPRLSDIKHESSDVILTQAEFWMRAKSFSFTLAIHSFHLHFLCVVWKHILYCFVCFCICQAGDRDVLFMTIISWHESLPIVCSSWLSHSNDKNEWNLQFVWRHPQFYLTATNILVLKLILECRHERSFAYRGYTNSSVSLKHFPGNRSAPMC